MKVLASAMLVCLSACSSSGSGTKGPRPPTQITVTGTPAGSILFVDGMQATGPAAVNDHPQTVSVAPGTHSVEIHMGDAVVYREETYVRAGERRMVRVLSGFAH